MGDGTERWETVGGEAGSADCVRIAESAVIARWLFNCTQLNWPGLVLTYYHPAILHLENRSSNSPARPVPPIVNRAEADMIVTSPIAVEINKKDRPARRREQQAPQSLARPVDNHKSADSFIRRAYRLTNLAAAGWWWGGWRAA
ncbi:hypothetical protein J6590_004348 [Homalodisca vitripennis]|nr:hypothetical protein J6590_004348 [Homalodisca vitripennis]